VALLCGNWGRSCWRNKLPEVLELVNAQGGDYSNALQAPSRGHQAVVQRLLGKGADVNAPGGYCGNALQAASVRGYEAITKRLLDKGAEAALDRYVRTLLAGALL